jgi:predicted HNH restriction endonuclease
MTTIPLSELRQGLPSLEESHYAALSVAAKWPCPRNIRGARSIGVTALLSLPDPSYVSLARDVLIGGDEETAPAVSLEGGRVAVLVNRFERDAGARKLCIQYHGVHCSVCDMSFGDRYGWTMKDLIHVHHLPTFIVDWYGASDRSDQGPCYRCALIATP